VTSSSRVRYVPGWSFGGVPRGGRKFVFDGRYLVVGPEGIHDSTMTHERLVDRLADRLGADPHRPSLTIGWIWREEDELCYQLSYSDRPDAGVERQLRVWLAAGSREGLH
jgi:hypothetical protein